MADQTCNTPTQILYNLYQEFSEEKNEIVNNINTQELRIAEIENYLNSIREKEDSDYQIFSPRETDSLYKEKKEQLSCEKESLEKRNMSCQKQLVKVNHRIQDIKELLDNLPMDNISITDRTDKTDIEEISLNRAENYKTLDIKEKEQQRIARDLHDSSLQTLTHIIHKIELCSKYITQDSVRAKLELAVINKYLKEVVQEIRNTIFDLHPMSIDDLGLKESLENLFTILQQDSNTKIELEIDIKECNDNLILVNIFHIVQELVTNALKHSEGTKVNVFITEEGENVYIKVEDDGKGFDIQNVDKRGDKHFGLSILTERIELLNGTVSIKSQIDEGTIVEVVVKSNIQ